VLCVCVEIPSPIVSWVWCVGVVCVCLCEVDDVGVCGCEWMWMCVDGVCDGPPSPPTSLSPRMTSSACHVIRSGVCGG